uniref:Opsin3 retinal G-protein-coupled receptor n=1 Tax=Phallusia mammillata TaxID=59560 RepID=A0A6F9DC44_9ASCI|nr:opsin3 retinal G-protein-coupled receptor [Phallusia mammillata]
MEILDKADFPIVALVTSINVILAVLGYAFIFVALAKSANLRRSSPWLLSLGVADLLFTVQVAMVAVACYMARWPFGDFGHIVHAYLALCMGLNAIASNAGALLDRLEMEKKTVLISSNKLALIGFAWTSGVLISFLYYLIIKPFTVTDTTFGCLVNLDDKALLPRLIIVFLSFGWFLVPVYYMARCCLLMGDSGKSAALIPASFLIAYTPFAICSLLSVTVGLDRIYYNNIWIHLMPKFTSAMNPWLHLYLNPQLRKVCSDMFLGNGQEKMH